ncbi:MAG: DUF4118 domain-containing protein [Oscillospiraceae bacterium]|jgi:two-component system sensor histidine kinase KdpD|nr:DUF4118 domain-containing protein [Oscillospiraceae bacterium]
MNKLASTIFRERPDTRSGAKIAVYNTAIMLGILAITILFTELLFYMHAGDQSLTMLYLLSVLIISLITPSYVYGIAAALIATLACDFFITEPRLGFSFTRGLPITLVTMLVATFLISTLTVQVKSQQRLATIREQRMQLLYEINQKLLAARDLETIISLTADYLIENLKRSVVFYTADPVMDPQSGHIRIYGDSGSADIFSNENEIKRVHRIFRHAAASLDMDDAAYGVVYVPVVSKETILGVIGINCENRNLEQGKYNFIQMLSGQVALALELQYLSNEQNRILVDAEKEKMRGTLLRSISHDLRTPLTSILGAGSTILEQTDMDRDTVENLTTDICDNAKWLIRMVENILTITKITSDTMTLHKKPEAVEEVISHTVSIVRKRFPGCNIHVRIPDELLMVPMDATLIAQVLINLLENAIKNSPEISLILMNVRRHETYVQFEVSDNGSGLPEHLLDDLFEIHPPHIEQAVDASRGMGIGLSICRTIIQAHGGYIEGHNRSEGGAKFTFYLPLGEGSRHGS